MSQAPLMLGVSGLRGIVGESLTPEVVVRYAAAFGTWLNQRDTCATVVVGRDGRAGGEELYNCAIQALRETGISVSEVDVAMTPTVGVMVDHGGADGGLIVTASHNPQQWNGLKILIRDINPEAAWAEGANCSAPPATHAAEIICLFENHETWSPEVQTDRQALAKSHGVHARLVVDAVGQFEAGALAAVVDSVNSSGTPASAELLAELGVACTQLAGEDSGIFPHLPEPTKENLSGEGGLCDAVPGLKADIGFAQDPDADRLAIVDENGRYIGEEYTLVLAAESLLQAGDSLASASGSSSPPVICVNLSTSRMIDDVAARHGARVVRTPVGEANVVEMMKKLRAEGQDVILAGEGNGGVIWPLVTYVRDSLSAMALTLALMARTGKTVSQLVDAMPSYVIFKQKQPLTSKADALPTIERLNEAFASDADAVIDTQDGIRIDWPDQRAWVHVRASNTEPILRVIAEAPDQAAAEGTIERVRSAMA